MPDHVCRTRPEGHPPGPARLGWAEGSPRTGFARLPGPGRPIRQPQHRQLAPPARSQSAARRTSSSDCSAADERWAQAAEPGLASERVLRRRDGLASGHEEGAHLVQAMVACGLRPGGPRVPASGFSRPLVAPAGLHPGKQPAVDISDFGAHGHLPPGVALLLAAVLGMLLAVIEALGRRMQQRNAAPKSPDLTPSAAPHSHDGVGGRIRPARQPADHKAGRPSRPGTRDNDPCRRQTEAPAVGHTRRGRISMRRSAKRLSLPVTLLAAGLLAAGCGGTISSSIGSLPSRTATAPARPSVTAAPTTQPPGPVATVTSAGHRFRGARRLLRHQPDLALGPAGRPCPGRADRLDRALGSPPLGRRGGLAVQARRCVRQRLGPA